jgi:hypothetical protein
MAIDRLNIEPSAGAAQLLDYWCAALDAGATRLSGLSRLLEKDARGDAVEEALHHLLATRPAMPPDALRAMLMVQRKFSTAPDCSHWPTRRFTIRT